MTPELQLPEWALPSEPRESALVDQAIRIPAAWWRDKVAGYGLPGTAPDQPRLTRADVWRHTDDVFTLLWHALAWGAGRFLRQNAKRLETIAADVPHARSVLTEAAGLSRTDPAAAYTLLRPNGRNAIKHLGPSFFTKFLYFAGGGAEDHPCLILDRRVATSLRTECGWTGLARTGPWSPDTYARYCAQLRDWASRHARAADEVELTLFNGAGRPRLDLVA
ncbi:MAG TPA: hypothetical protein VNP92_34095 [Actinophytocola sp.]|nr:hypothetical protein [Actinophytocola sp.]